MHLPLRSALIIVALPPPFLQHDRQLQPRQLAVGVLGSGIPAANAILLWSQASQSLPRFCAVDHDNRILQLLRVRVAIGRKQLLTRPPFAEKLKKILRRQPRLCL
jgi:hypothetical protein